MNRPDPTAVLLTRWFGRRDIDAGAVARFRQLMIYTTIAGVIAAVASVGYLALNDVLNLVTGSATILGVFFSVFLGGGLMAVGFLSSNSGHDDDATGPRGS